MKKPVLVLCVSTLLSAVLLSGCATITRGRNDTLVVESDPSGADVQLSTGQVGKTPTSFQLKRGDPLVVTISKEGYETLHVNVTPQVVGAGAAGMAGNVLVGGLIGAGVDAWSGAMKDLKPNPVTVKLVKLAEKEPARAVASDQSIAAKLKELRAALDSGLITQAEYDRERAKIVPPVESEKIVAKEPASPTNTGTPADKSEPSAPAPNPKR
jgi:hypothetical protein